MIRLEDLDVGIRDIVAALWVAKIDTDASCSGHGERSGYVVLKDGRLLFVLTRPYQKELLIEGQLSLKASLQEAEERGRREENEAWQKIARQYTCFCKQEGHACSNLAQHILDKGRARNEKT